MHINKKERAKIKNMFGGHCAYCGIVLGDKFHIDHAKPLIRNHDIKKCEKTGTFKFVNNGTCCNPQNNTKDNLMPACIPCNIHKSSLDVDQFRKHLAWHLELLNGSNNYSIYRHAKRFGLIEEKPRDIVFYFETFNKEVNNG